MSKIVTRTPAEVYQLWIEALRSGKYKQTDGTLKSYTTGGKPAFCCLGVVCDLARKDGGDKWEDNHYKDESGQLPDKIRKFMKMTLKQEEKLIELNDTNRYNFKQIADYVETEIMPQALSKTKVMS